MIILFAVLLPLVSLANEPHTDDAPIEITRWESGRGPKVRLSQGRGPGGWGTFGESHWSEGPYQIARSGSAAFASVGSESGHRGFVLVSEAGLGCGRAKVIHIQHDDSPYERWPPMLQERCPDGAAAWADDIPGHALQVCLDKIRARDGSESLVMVATDRDARGLVSLDVTSDEAERVPSMILMPRCVRHAVPDERSPATWYGLEFVRDASGEPITITETRDGIRDGFFYVLRPSTAPAVIGAYRDGLEHGLWVWLDPEGRITRARAYVFGVAYPMGIADAQ